MNMISACVWYGHSEEAYHYQIFPLEVGFRDLGGNYILCYRDVLGDWSPFYIGQTDNLCQCLGDFELNQWVRQQGVAYIHAHLNRHDADRDSEMTDLVSRFLPPLNRLKLN